MQSEKSESRSESLKSNKMDEVNNPYGAKSKKKQKQKLLLGFNSENIDRNHITSTPNLGSLKSTFKALQADERSRQTLTSLSSVKQVQ